MARLHAAIDIFCCQLRTLGRVSVAIGISGSLYIITISGRVSVANRESDLIVWESTLLHNEIREYHRRHPAALVVDANEEHEALFKEEPQVEFSGEVVAVLVTKETADRISVLLTNLSEPKKL